MRMITYLRDDNTTYIGVTPMSPDDMAIPDRPAGAWEFDREQYKWVAVTETSAQNEGDEHAS